MCLRYNYGRIYVVCAKITCLENGDSAVFTNTFVKEPVCRHKKKTKHFSAFGFFLFSTLDCAVYFTGAQAAGANVYVDRTLNYCSYLLNIGFPSTFGVSIGVVTLLPACLPLPQISQMNAIISHLLERNKA